MALFSRLGTPNLTGRYGGGIPASPPPVEIDSRPLSAPSCQAKITILDDSDAPGGHLAGWSPLRMRLRLHDAKLFGQGSNQGLHVGRPVAEAFHEGLVVGQGLDACQDGRFFLRQVEALRRGR